MLLVFGVASGPPSTVAGISYLRDRTPARYSETTSSILYMQHVGGKGGFESPAALERRVHGRARLRVAVERVLDDGVVGTIRN